MSKLFDYKFREVKGQPFLMIEIFPAIIPGTVDPKIHCIAEMICRENNVNPVEHWIIFKRHRDKWKGYLFSTKQEFQTGEEHWLKAAIKTIQG